MSKSQRNKEPELELNRFGKQFIDTLSDNERATYTALLARIQSRYSVMSMQGGRWQYRPPKKRIGLAIMKSGAALRIALHTATERGQAYEAAQAFSEENPEVLQACVVPEGNTFPADREAIGARPESIQSRVRPGCSTSHIDGSAGTVGCVVTWEDDEGEEVFGFVSASHVVGDFNAAETNDQVVVPAVQDLAYSDQIPAENIVGTLQNYITLNVHNERRPGNRWRNVTDIGLVKLKSADKIHDEKNFVKVPGDQVVELQLPDVELNYFEILNQTVFKLGQSSGLTSGTLKHVCLEPVGFRHNTFRKGAKSVYIYDELIIISSNSDEPFSVPGDSGAPVYLDDGTLLGFVIGGASGFTYVTPAQSAFERLGSNGNLKIRLLED